jgi:hypothetical protein
MHMPPGVSTRGFAAAAKIKVDGSIVDLDGDEMTRYAAINDHLHYRI